MIKNEKPNIIWFMIDSLRNEFLYNFGCEFAKQTFLDNLLSECVSFTNCRSVAPYTIASLTAKMTGCYPSVNYIDGWLKKNPLKALNPECLTIIDMFKYHGYTTTYIASSSSCAYISPDSFDNYLCCNGSDNFPVDIVVGKNPSFTIMLIDIIHDACCEHIGKFDSRMYVSNVEKVSGVVEEYYNRMKSDNDLVLITSDHGVRVIDELENTAYSKEFVTGRFLTEKTTRCSFNLKWKKHFEPCRISQMVRSVDIFPTLMDVLGWEYPLLDGVSLLPFITKKVDLPVIKYAYTLTGWSAMDPKTPGLWAIIDTEGYKLVVSKKYRGIKKRKIIKELFDLNSDPNEEKDVLSLYPDKAQELYLELKAKLMHVRDIKALYAQKPFDYQSYLAFRYSNRSVNSLSIANNIIIENWQKKVRRKFLINFYVNKFKMLIRYYLIDK